jgi:hypothetical protein
MDGTKKKRKTIQFHGSVFYQSKFIDPDDYLSRKMENLSLMYH